MKSMLFKMIGLAVVAAALALFGGYGIGYDAKAWAGTGPNGHGVQNVPQGFMFTAVPRGLALDGVRPPDARRGEMLRFERPTAGRPGVRGREGLNFASRPAQGRPGVSHHRGLQPRPGGGAQL